MRKASAFLVILSLACLALAAAARASRPPEPSAAAQYQDQGQDESSYQPYSDDQLDNLLAPIALYPDPLLAQVLIAATFTDQIDEADRWVRTYGQNGVDDQPWDISVRAVAHYPSVLDMLDSNLDWTTALGQAYVYQSNDVMASVQRLRALAEQQGNLVSTPQQQVIVEDDGDIEIWPASPQYIYVPVYDPDIVFFSRVYDSGVFTAAFSFGAPSRIGVWLDYDCDWREHRVRYTGWQGGGWVARSRPYVQITNVYVNVRYTNITVNRQVVQRQVNYQSLERFQTVHREAGFADRARTQQPPPPRPEARVPNKIIDRNINSNQSLEPFRGRQPQPPQQPVFNPPQRQRQPQPPQQPVYNPPQRQRQPAQPPQQPPVYNPPQRQRPPQPPQPPVYNPPQRQRQPAQPPQQPVYNPPQRQRQPAQPPNAFGQGDGSFNSRMASERGQQSRQQMNQRPAPPPAREAPKPPPPQRPRHGGGD